MLSQTNEYALRAVAGLATRPDEPMVTRDLAELTHVPPSYLSKVLQQLSRGGLVRATRGLGGGFALARPPEQITVLDVIDAVDPLQRIRTCPLGLKAHGAHLCPLHRRLDNAMAMVEDAFRQTTIAEVLAEPSRSKPLCNVPTPTAFVPLTARKRK